MNRIKQKLRSRAGVSMILAMVFMLFCFFIGGTVLASATANAQRVAQMAEQQDFLLEQSAALLLTDQLQMDAGAYVRLVVVDQDRTIQGMNKGNGGVFTPIEGAVAYDRVITFQVITNTELQDLHQLLLEGAVWRYLRENTADEDPGKRITYLFENFPGNPTSLNSFLFSDPRRPDDYLIEGSLNVTASNFSGGTVSEIPSYTANFSVGRELHAYDFFVDFGEDSQLKMTMNAYSGTGSPAPVPGMPVDNNTGLLPGTDFVQIDVISTQTTISWEAPLIEKGGAQR